MCPLRASSQPSPVTSASWMWPAPSVGAGGARRSASCCGRGRALSRMRGDSRSGALMEWISSARQRSGRRFGQGRRQVPVGRQPAPSSTDRTVNACPRLSRRRSPPRPRAPGACAGAAWRRAPPPRPCAAPGGPRPARMRFPTRRWPGRRAFGGRQPGPQAQGDGVRQVYVPRRVQSAGWMGRGSPAMARRQKAWGAVTNRRSLFVTGPRPYTMPRRTGEQGTPSVRAIISPSFSA